MSEIDPLREPLPGWVGWVYLSILLLVTFVFTALAVDVSPLTAQRTIEDDEAAALAASRQKATRAVGPRFAALLLALAAPLLAAPALANYPDWPGVSDVQVIDVVTHDADGDLRETKVWFVLLDGVPYLRTSGSRWLENLRRDPNLVLRITGREYEARAEEVPGDAIVEQVDRATVEKYGWQERLIHVFRMRKPEILRLSPR